ncbi:MAG: ribonuclease HII [Bacteroides sp.]|nr:ribonuclease HII [Bacteroides sp.]MCM1096170.1 ribonuclease HII [Terasakiella sp.]
MSRARIADTVLPPALVAGVLEAGCDEAGRGCLAGPVVAAAVILPEGYCRPGIVDSKKLSEARREELRAIIMEEAVAWAVGICSPAEIDELNILRASITAMHRAVDALAVRPGALAVDGNRFIPYPGIAHTTVVKGDARLADIAAASIIAKTTRDHIMAELHARYPQYGWDVNKGYPTAAHRAAIAAHGPSPEHRMSFRLG